MQRLSHSDRQGPPVQTLEGPLSTLLLRQLLRTHDLRTLKVAGLSVCDGGIWFHRAVAKIAIHSFIYSLTHSSVERIAGAMHWGYGEQKFSNFSTQHNHLESLLEH